MQSNRKRKEMDADTRTKDHEERFLRLFGQVSCRDLVNLYCNALEAQRDAIVLKPGETERITNEGFAKSSAVDFEMQIKSLRESEHTSPDSWARTWAYEMRNPQSPVAKAIEDMCATARWMCPEEDQKKTVLSANWGNVYDNIPLQAIPARDDWSQAETLTADLMALHAAKGPIVFTKLFCAALEEQPDLDPIDMTELLDGKRWIDMKRDDHLLEGHEVTSEDEDAMVAIHDEWKDTAIDLELEYDIFFREMQIAFFEKQGGRVPPSFRDSFRLSYKSLPEIAQEKHNELHVAMQIEFFRKHGARIPAFVLANVLANEVELGNQQTAEIARTMGIDL